MYDNKITDFLKENYKISDDVIKMAETAENDLKEMFAEADRITEYNQYKVLNAMQKNKAYRNPTFKRICLERIIYG